MNITMVHPDIATTICMAVWQTVGRASNYENIATKEDKSFQAVWVDNRMTVIMATPELGLSIYQADPDEVYKHPELYPLTKLVVAIKNVQAQINQGEIPGGVLLDLVIVAAECLKSAYGQKGTEALCQTLGITEKWLETAILSLGEQGEPLESPYLDQCCLEPPSDQ